MTDAGLNVERWPERLQEVREQAKDKQSRAAQQAYINGLVYEYDALLDRVAALEREQLTDEQIDERIKRYHNVACGYQEKSQQWAARAQDAIDEVARLRAVLEFYADPETYFAVGFFPDPPCGDFVDDFSETELGVKPGKRARAVLDAVSGAASAPPAKAAPSASVQP